MAKTRALTAKQQAKKLDAEISNAFRTHGSNIQFSILNLPKIYEYGRTIAATGGDVEQAVIDAIQVYREN